MPRTLNVSLLPRNAADLSGRCAIVIDVLRATTTIVQALASGATGVYPCRTVGEARELARDLKPTPLLAGERNCLRVEGFDLGNSPLEHSADVVGGREVVFTTTNGTAAMLQSESADSVILAAFTNLSAVIHHVRDEPSVAIICSGTNGCITRDDVLLAGAIVSRLAHADENAGYVLNDEARLALAAWRELGIIWDAKSAIPALAVAFESTLGGRNLLHVGGGKDLMQAAQVDRWAVVPQFLPEERRIVVVGWREAVRRSRL